MCSVNKKSKVSKDYKIKGKIQTILISQSIFLSDLCCVLFIQYINTTTN